MLHTEILHGHEFMVKVAKFIRLNAVPCKVCDDDDELFIVTDLNIHLRLSSPK